jgi:Kef-type K+ transport system membrane component KefB
MMVLINKLYAIFSQHIFLALAGMLILGPAIGRIANSFKLPRITGYILTGIVFGPSILKMFSDTTLTQLEFMPEFALGIVALLIGGGLSIDLLKRLGWRMFLITLGESFGAFFLVLFGLLALKMPLGAALPLAAIAPATAPAATLAIIKEYRCQGTMTETVLAIVALDDALSIVLFGLVLSIDVSHLENVSAVLLHSLSGSVSSILLSLLVGSVLGLLAHFLMKAFKDVADSVIIILGMVFLGISVAAILNISTLLTNMFIGFALINLSSGNEEIIKASERLTPPLYCLFFVLAGAHLNFAVFQMVGWTMLVWGVVFILLRGAGQIGGAYLAAVAARLPEKIRRYLGLTLIPQAGVAIGLSLLIAQGSSYFAYRSVILNITLMAVAVNEIVGPILTKYAFFKAKEAVIVE